MVKKLIVGLFLVFLVILVGCSRPSISQKIVSVNIVNVESHVNYGKLDEEQICSVCNNGYFIAKEGDDPYQKGQKVTQLGDSCSDLIEIQANIQVENYNSPVSCIVYIDGTNTEGENSIVSYNGLNKFKAARKDLRYNSKIKICCSDHNDGYECTETNVPPRCMNN